MSSASVLILQDTTGSALTGQAYTVGSPWDGNTNVRGYPCIDQPGRGVGDLTPQANFPSKTPAAWPNQALEPIYYWANTGAPASGYSGSFLSDQTAGRMTANQDYYAQASGIQSNATTPFNGTSGTGWGTIANRPATCTIGVGYWATDQGSWNSSTTNPYGVQQSGADGKMYVCTATNTWTARYGDNATGEPLAYPHPLRGGS